MNKVPFTWEEYADSMSRLYRRIKEDGVKIDRVFGISRGGVKPAEYFAAMLNKGLTVLYPAAAAAQPIKQEVKGQALLVDEICDSGSTFLEVLEALRACNDDPHIITLSIHRRYSSLYTPDYYDILIPNDDCWIVYPWEQQG